ncbi:MAG: family 20 glycosylhydrolase [Chloroflexi bacterium]|nr:family 20 glycosylhydrolase [Chloroflexota bacterium]
MGTLTLLPLPRHLTLTGGSHQLASGKRIALESAQPSGLLFSAQRLQSVLANLNGVAWALAATASGPSEEIGAILRVDAARGMPAQGYELTITPERISLTAADEAGIFYGVCTLIQILEQTEDAAVPCMHVRDWPDFPARGVMLDISRDKVPSMETLYALVDLLGSWKINQLQLYTEHTFSYRQHPAVWADASPMTEEEILELDAYCRRRAIELVPNQNSFGHMHRWLKHPQYAPLAEVASFEQWHWWGRGPFSVCPLDPGSIALLTSLYDELLPNFSSGQFNVGADETFDLGLGRSRAECERRGVGRVYLDFLLKIHDAVNQRGRTMQFWGDIIIKHPELIPELPKDAVALEWGYEGAHPFDEHGAKFAAAGIPFYVCPGTATWNSVAGRTDNAMQNLLNAAQNGLKHGAVGYLNTDWGDQGHWQFLPVSYLGFAYGAGVSWCAEANGGMDVIGALNRFAFRDRAGAMGKVAYAMGNVYQSLGPTFHNASGLARILLLPTAHGQRAFEEIRKIDGLSPASFERAMDAIADAMRPIGKQKMRRADAALIADEYECAADLLHHACGLGLLAFEDDPKVARPLKRKLAADMKRLVKEYRRLWLARNREGGLNDSAARLENVRAVVG